MARLKVYDQKTQSWVYADRSFGKIPVKGIDYYTEEDRAEFESFIVDELAKRGQLDPAYANSVADCVDTTKLYVLPDGYIYAYSKDGGYTNLVPTATDIDGNTLNGVGYQDGYRLNYSDSGASMVAESGFVSTGFIPIQHTDIIRMYGATWTSTNKSVIAFYDGDKNPLSGYIGNGYVVMPPPEYFDGIHKPICLQDKTLQSVTTENGESTFNITYIEKNNETQDWDAVPAGSTIGLSGYHVKYMRISAQGNGADMIVTLNEEIYGNEPSGYAWRNTGHAFVPADYEDRIIELEGESEEASNSIVALQQQVEDIVAGNTAIAAISKFDPSEYNIPVLYLTGSTAAMSKDTEVTLDWAYKDWSGSCTLKWQGSSSIAYAKKNYTIKLDSKIEVVDGWGAQKKYCLKANYIDHTHARNIVSAKLWSQIVASRSPSNAILASCPNYGAVDGFPIAIMMNGEFHGLYTWNIPKDKWTFNMGDGEQEAVICANIDTPAVNMRVHSKVDGSDHELEEVTDEDNAGWVATSLNNVIDMCVNSYGADLDTTIAQYLDWESAIDYYIFTVLMDGRDMVHKNYIMVTWNGTKWVFSAYDMDSTYGLHWDGSTLLPPHEGVTFESFRCNRVMELIYRFKANALKARYKKLRESVLSEYAISNAFESFGCAVPSRLLAEDSKKWPSIPSTSVNTTDQILRWLHFRLQLVDKWIDEIPEQETPIAPASRTGNVVPASIDKNGAVYNGVGYKNGYTINTSNNSVDTESALDGCCVTGYIPFTKDNILSVTTDNWNISPTNSRIIFYNANFVPMAYYTQHGFVGLHNGYTNKTAILAKDKHSVTYNKDGMTTLNIAYGADCTDLAYVRIRGVGNGQNMVVTVK